MNFVKSLLLISFSFFSEIEASTLKVVHPS
jgi:hypothetical protein